MTISKLPTSASLKEVMDKFEEISLQDFSSIDIITASELPSSGKEGQICIITDIEPNSIILNLEVPTSPVETDIFIKYYTMSTPNVFYVEDSKTSISLNLKEVKQYKSGSWVEVKSYLNVNGEWVDMNPEFIIYAAPNNYAGGSFVKTALGSGSSYNYISDAGVKGIEVCAKGGSYAFTSIYGIYNKLLDMTNYATLEFEITKGSQDATMYFSFGLTKNSAFAGSSSDYLTFKSLSRPDSGKYSVDISNQTGNMYIAFSTGNRDGSNTSITYIKSVTLKP